MSSMLPAGDEALLAAIADADAEALQRVRFLPVAVPYGELSEETADLEGDPHEIVVRSLDAARLRRHLRGLPRRERAVVAGLWGVGCEPLSARALATRLGLDACAVCALEEAGLEALRASYRGESGREVWDVA